MTAPMDTREGLLEDSVRDLLEILEGAQSGFIPGCDSDAAWQMGRDARIAKARDALAALPSPELPAGGVAPDAWRPIETAPKDVNILVAHDGFVSEAYFNLETESFWPANTAEHDFDPSHPIYPTHWQPLPPSPERKEGRS